MPVLDCLDERIGKHDHASHTQRPTVHRGRYALVYATLDEGVRRLARIEEVLELAGVA